MALSRKALAALAPRGEVEVDHLAVGIDGASEIVPPATDADVGFVDMPVYTRTAQVFPGTPGQFGTELLNPAIDGRAINGDIALCQEINHILIGAWITQVLTNSTQDDLTRKAMMLEWGFTRHCPTSKAQKWPNQTINATVPFTTIGASHHPKNGINHIIGLFQCLRGAHR